MFLDIFTTILKIAFLKKLLGFAFLFTYFKPFKILFFVPLLIRNLFILLSFVVSEQRNPFDFYLLFQHLKGI